MKNLFQRAIAIVFAAAALAANAGGPLSLCSAGLPVKYPGAGSVTMNYDLGTLGSRTNAQAAAIVNAALATWTNVGTATIAMTRGANLPVDVTTANYLTYLGNSSFGDGLNPVVYDTDGSLTDLMLGPGASNNVLGFAGSAYNLSPCQYVEGRAVINGKIAVSDATMTTVLTHELGHFIGLDHTQLDGAQGLPTSNYPLMYPIAYRTNAGLHDDDIAAISALYPDITVNATYGTLTGTFVTSGGTPILGANIWAQNTTTGKVFSVVSDYLQQGTGYFKLLLTPGAYTLHAEAIDTGFTGGSGVGPYSNDLTDASFQPPLYSGTTPMTPVTFGTPFTIAAGCNATVTFRINGTGSVGGNCSTLIATSTALVSSANPSNGQAVTFTASVTPSSGTPTGTVLFQANGMTIAGCSAVALTGALTAACTTSALPLGPSSIVASYSGSGTHAASASATLVQTVSHLASAVTLATSVNPSNIGEVVMFTATITGSGNPITGTVLFRDGSNAIGGCSTLGISGGTSVCTTTALTTPGPHSITAVYSGDLTYIGSTSGVVTQTITTEVNVALASSGATASASSLYGPG